MIALTFLFISLQALGLISLSNQECHHIPAPDHGSIFENLRFYQVICERGYALQGKPIVYCFNNEWDNPPPVCIKSTVFCKELPAPENGKIICDAPPFSFGKVCRFECNEGYELTGPKRRTCANNYRWSGFATNCIALSGTVCQPPPPLGNGTVIGCSKTKLPRVSQKCSFRCNPGFVLEGPLSVTCTTTGSLIDSEGKENFPKCVDAKKQKYPNNPCDVENGGCEQLCNLDNRRQVFCSCRNGYIRGGIDLKSCIKIEPQQPESAVPISCQMNNGGCERYCSDKFRIVQCYCDRGYKLHADEKRCVVETRPPPAPVTPVTCRINNGGCEHICNPQRRTVHCSCQRGYTLHSDGKHCTDIDECSIEWLNKCQHECTNTKGSYKCSCRPGYVLMDEYKCEGCGKNSYQSPELNGCTDCPPNSHTDSDGKTSVRDCVCDSGYVGNPGDDIKCEEVNECSINNFGCSDTCVNVPGSAFCSCPVGFKLDSNNKTCIDIDECSIKNGGCEGICQNLHGSFRCSCQEGYSLSNKDHYSCDDVDECLDNNGGCEHKCINYRGGYYCACEDGYRLDKSGSKNCTDIQCPALPISPYSHVTCKRKGVKLVEMESYPVGTICTFTCEKGFKDTTDSEAMECQKGGTWQGKFPTCKAQHCEALSVPQNGAVHPSFCSTQGNAVKKKCTFTCNPGYKLVGKYLFNCRNNLTWNNPEIPACELEKIQPKIQCPGDITEILLPGMKTHNISLEEPTTNTENYKVHPDWVSFEVPNEFQAGITRVIFTAISPNSNKTARCVVTITVLDKESPVFEFCPDPIKIEGAGADGELVTWEEPVVTDNVEVESIFSILEPNTTLTPGTYVVEYIARDRSGNIASCSFDINIIRMNCSDLLNPVHGEANCVDWMFGKFCQPQCEDGYMRYPEEPAYYSCDDSGVWEPSEIISECLPFVPATSSACPEGFVLTTNDETSSEVCVGCPSNTVWSSAKQKCEEATI